MPSFFAYIAVIGFPLVAIILFRSLSFRYALVWTILGGYLFLPSRPGFDVPLLPDIDKAFVPAVAAGVLGFGLQSARREYHRRMARRRESEARALARRQLAGEIAPSPAPSPSAPSPSAPSSSVSPPVPSPPERRQRVAPPVAEHVGRYWLTYLLIFAAFASPVLTALNNTSPLAVGAGKVLPGLRLYDAGSVMLNTLVALLPFLLARRFLGTREAFVEVLKILCYAGILYSLFILIEVRLSPQLNRWIYGFTPSSFLQHIRYGGFRPIVFLPHGLWVGIFMAMAVISAVVLTKIRARPFGKGWILIAAWLFFGLFISKTIGATAIAVLLCGAVLLPNLRLAMLLSAALAGAVLLYPMLRGAGAVPTVEILEFVNSYDVDRGQSLGYRFNNEDILLTKAAEKPMTGWGGWGRARVYDPQTGEDITVTDGSWIILIGNEGWIGYIAKFGLLILPALLLTFQRRKLDLETVGMVLVLTANLVDLIPNATLTPLTWMLAGAIAGRYEQIRAEARAGAVPEGDRARRRRSAAQIAATPAATPASAIAGRHHRPSRTT